MTRYFSDPKTCSTFLLTGKRVCVGEAIAKMELIVFSAMILKNFKISAPPGGTIDINPLHPNVIVSPSNDKQDVLIEKRKQKV